MPGQFVHALMAIKKRVIVRLAARCGRDVTLAANLGVHVCDVTLAANLVMHVTHAADRNNAREGL